MPTFSTELRCFSLSPFARSLVLSLPSLLTCCTPILNTSIPLHLNRYLVLSFYCLLIHLLLLPPLLVLRRPPWRHLCLAPFALITSRGIRRLQLTHPYQLATAASYIFLPSIHPFLVHNPLHHRNNATILELEDRGPHIGAAHNADVASIGSKCTFRYTRLLQASSRFRRRHSNCKNNPDRND